MTKKQWTIIAVGGIAVVVVFAFLGCLILAVLVRQSSPQADQVAKPTPTLAVLALTIDDIEHCCSNMTTVQQNQYLATLVGKRVNWQGTVDDTKLDGTIWVRVSSTLIEMNNAPSDVLSKLSKGQSINFYAIITKAENSFLLPGVQLRFESLNTNPVAANAIPTQKATGTPILPTTTPTPTKPLTPNEKLAQLAKDSLNESGLSKMALVFQSATITGTTAVVAFKPDEGAVTEELIVTPFVEHIQIIAPEVFAGFPTVNSLEVDLQVILVDVYGKTSEGTGIRAVITRATNDKIDWKNFYAKNWAKVLTGKGDSFFVHKALSNGWATYQKSY